MEGVDESTLPVAGVYAEALYELARERDLEQTVAAQLAELCDYLDADPEFETFITSAAIDQDRRERSLEKMFRGRMSDTLLDTLLVMNRKGRLFLLKALQHEFTHLCHVGHNQQEVTVYTAVPLEKRERNALIEQLARISGKKIDLKEHVVEDMLGGLVVEIGDRRLDASLITRLKQMRRRMYERAGEEIHSGKKYFAET
jgi:F-type H+-transporting ATPase subunit delta